MPKTINVGIHGSRGSGKTCYFAALYGKRTDDHTSVALQSNETIDLLAETWDQLSSGHRPLATAQSLPQHIELSLTQSDVTSNIITCDYSGSLIQRSKDVEPHLKKEVYDWMEDSDVLLIFVDMQQLNAENSEGARERQNEIDLLISALQKDSRITKPLALVLTKWDLHSRNLNSPEEENEKAHVFVHKHYLLSQIAKGVELAGQDFEVFPVSSFGGNVDGENPPDDGVHPFNTLAPLAWGVNQVQRICAARRRKNQMTILGALLIALLVTGIIFHLLGNYFYESVVNAPNPEAWRWHNLLYKAAKNFRNASWLFSGVALTLLLYNIVKRSVINKKNKSPAALLILIGLACGTLAPASIGFEKGGAHYAVAQYLDSNDGKNEFRVAQASGKNSPSDRRLERLEQLESSAYNNLKKPKHSDSPNDQERKINAYKKFIKEFAPSPSKPERIGNVEGWIKDAKIIYEQSAKASELKYEVETFLRKVDRVNLQERLDLIDNFLREHPGHTLPDMAKADIDRVKQKRREVMRDIEDREWTTVKQFVRDNSKRYKDCIDHIDTYLNQNPQSRYLDKANNMKEEIERAWDFHNYKALRDRLNKASRSNTMPHGISIETLKRDLQAYKNRDYPTPRMRDYVNRWIKWADKLKKGSDVSITIDAVEVVRGGYLAASWGNTTIWVKVSSGHTERETKQKKKKITSGRGQNKFTFDESVGPFDYKLGDKVSITVMGDRAFWPNDRDMTVKITPLTKEVVLKKAGNREGTLYLRFAGQPDLPEYEKEE